MTLLAMVEQLSRADIAFAIVGGLAARLHGSRQVTDDADICYRTTEANETALVAQLRQWRAYPKDWVPGRPFTLTRAHLAEGTTLRLSTALGDIDIMRVVPGVGTYEDIVARADTMEITGHQVPVINLEQLIRAKETAGRPKDRLALEELRSLRSLRLELEMGLADPSLRRPPSPADALRPQPTQGDRPVEPD